MRTQKLSLFGDPLRPPKMACFLALPGEASKTWILEFHTSTLITRISHRSTHHNHTTWLQHALEELCRRQTGTTNYHNEQIWKSRNKGKALCVNYDKNNRKKLDQWTNRRNREKWKTWKCQKQQTRTNLWTQTKSRTKTKSTNRSIEICTCKQTTKQSWRKIDLKQTNSCNQTTTNCW